MPAQCIDRESRIRTVLLKMSVLLQRDQHDPEIRLLDQRLRVSTSSQPSFLCMELRGLFQQIEVHEGRGQVSGKRFVTRAALLLLSDFPRRRSDLLPPCRYPMSRLRCAGKGIA